jgi:hypothetical protein
VRPCDINVCYFFTPDETLLVEREREREREWREEREESGERREV